MHKKTILVFLICVPFLVGMGYFSFLSNYQKLIFNYQQFSEIQSNLKILNNELSNFASKEDFSLKSKEVSLIAVGDIMLSRTVAKKIKANGDLNFPFLKTAEFLRSGDIVFGNLECPITAGREIQSGEMIFHANPGVEQALAKAGFSILSLANNHSMNFNVKGIEDTFKYLSNVNIKYVGAGKNDEEAYSPVFVKLNDFTFAFLAYTDPSVVPISYKAGKDRPGVAFMDVEKMVKAVNEAKKIADFVIVSMHAGNEYVFNPNQFQINFAHAAIDAGAEIVIGHHPHVIQKVEKYKGKWIIYSLGNFVFDQMWSQETREGLIAKIIFDENGVKNIEFTPILIEDYAQPKILEGEDAERILKKLNITPENIF
jgi:poly-gamma-glutamate synthesis protein (capsule biosynthesis protein)